MRIDSTKEEYLIKGHNGLETGVILSEMRFFDKERRFMDRATVNDVIRRFNDDGVRYCLVGGLAMAHHSIPRRTQDVDILVLPEDVPTVQRQLQGYQQRGTAVALVFQIGETRIDIIPANLRAKRAAVLGCIEDMMEDLPVKVVNLRDLILLKLWVAPERPELGKRMQDEADIVTLIETNAEKVSPETVAYICRSLLAMAYSPEDVRKYRGQVEWLNELLEKLSLSDRRYGFPA